MISISNEALSDLPAIRDVTIAAFEASEFGHSGEADLIEALRTKSAEPISLVALEDGVVVGHIMFSEAIIRCGIQQKVHGMGLAPMSVLPSHQNRGIGSLLVKAGLSQIDGGQAAFTVVTGHRDYYPRFGFRPASEFDIMHGFNGMPQDILFVRPAPKTADLATTGGLLYYHSAFGPQHETD